MVQINKKICICSLPIFTTLFFLKEKSHEGWEIVIISFRINITSIHWQFSERHSDEKNGDGEKKTDMQTVVKLRACHSVYYTPMQFSSWNPNTCMIFALCELHVFPCLISFQQYQSGFEWSTSVNPLNHLNILPQPVVMQIFPLKYKSHDGASRQEQVTKQRVVGFVVLKAPQAFALRDLRLLSSCKLEVVMKQSISHCLLFQSYTWVFWTLLCVSCAPVFFPNL